MVFHIDIFVALLVSDYFYINLFLLIVCFVQLFLVGGRRIISCWLNHLVVLQTDDKHTLDVWTKLHEGCTADLLFVCFLRFVLALFLLFVFDCFKCFQSFMVLLLVTCVNFNSYRNCCLVALWLFDCLITFYFYGWHMTFDPSMEPT